MKFIVTILCFAFVSCTSAKVTTRTLDGSKSFDVDGYIEKWYWRQLTKGTAQILNPISMITVIRLKGNGEIDFELTGIDNDGGIGRDTIRVVF